MERVWYLPKLAEHTYTIDLHLQDCHKGCLLRGGILEDSMIKKEDRREATTEIGAAAVMPGKETSRHTMAK